MKNLQHFSHGENCGIKIMLPCQTYNEFLSLLLSMTPDQLNCTPTIYDGNSDEYYPISTILTASDTNCALDNDHP